MKIAAMFGSSTGAVATAAGAAVVVVAGAVGITVFSDQTQAPEGVMPAPEPVAVEGASGSDPAPEAAPMAPRLDVVRVGADGQALIAGRAAPGAALSLRLDGDGIAEMAGDGGGNFVAMVQIPPSEAPRLLSVVALSADGREIAGPDTVIVAPFAAPVAAALAPTEPPVAPELPEAAQPVPEGLAVIAPPQQIAPPARAVAPAVIVTGPEGVRISQAPQPQLQGESPLRLDAISYTAQGAVVLTGRGPGASDLRILLDNQPIQLGEVARDGTWSLQIPDVDPGTYTLSVAALDDAGREEARVETPFLREDPARVVAAPQAAAETGVEVITVQPGFTLWGIAQEQLGDGILYVQIFEENRDQIRDPNWIFPGQIFQMPGEAARADLPQAAGN